MLQLPSCTKKTARVLLLGGVSVFALIGFAVEGMARESSPSKPTVEVNLDALEALQKDAPLPPKAPLEPKPAVAPAPPLLPITSLPTVAGHARQAPAEQPEAKKSTLRVPALPPIGAPIRQPGVDEQAGDKPPASAAGVPAVAPAAPAKPLPTPAPLPESHSNPVRMVPKLQPSVVSPAVKVSVSEAQVSKPAAPAAKQVPLPPKAPLKSVTKPVLPRSVHDKPMPAVTAPKPAVNRAASVAPVQPAPPPVKPAPVAAAKPDRLPPLPLPLASELPAKPTAIVKPKEPLPTLAPLPEIAPVAAPAKPLPEPQKKVEPQAMPMPAPKPSEVKKSEPKPVPPVVASAAKPPVNEVVPAAKISTAPMIVPLPDTVVPKPSTDLPLSVSDRIAKIFSGEPKQQGVVKDERTVKNLLAEKQAKDAEAKAASALKGEASNPAPVAAPVEPVEQKVLVPAPVVAAAKPGVDEKLVEIKPEVKPASDAKVPPALPVAAPKTVLPSLSAITGDAPPRATESAPLVKEEVTPPPVPVVTKVEDKPAPVPVMPIRVAPKSVVTIPKPVKELKPAGEKKPEVVKSVLPEPMPVAQVKQKSTEVKPNTVEPEKTPVLETKKLESSTKPVEPVKLPDPAALPSVEKKTEPSVKPVPAKAVVPEVKKVEPVQPPKPALVMPPLPPLPTKPAPVAKVLPPLPMPPLPEKKIEPVQPPPVPAPVAEKKAERVVPVAVEKIEKPVEKLPPSELPPVVAAPALPEPLPVPPVRAKDEAKNKRPQLASTKLPVPDTAIAPVEAKPLEEPKLLEPKLPDSQMKGELPPLPAGMPPLPAVSSKEDAPSLTPVPVIKAAGGADKLVATLSFAKEKSDLSSDTKSQLADIAKQLKKSQGSARIVAYAGGSEEESPVARRLSLARASQVRAYLIDKGVNPMVLVVQAMGNKVNGGDAERAEVFVK